MQINFKKSIGKGKVIILGMLFSFIFIANGSAQKQDDATSYLQFIDQQNEKVVTQVWEYMQSYTFSNDLALIKGKRQKLKNILNDGIHKIQRAESYDQQLKTAALNYLRGNLAIVENDLGSLLKNQESYGVTVNHMQIVQNIRKAVLELRNTYNAAIRDYSKRHQIKVVKNDSDVALNMEQTIIIYDYYNELQRQFSLLQNAESEFWKGLNDATLEQYEQKKTVFLNQLLSPVQLERWNTFPSDRSLFIQLKAYNQFLQKQISANLKAIEIVKEAAVTGDRIGIMKKTENYNEVIHQSNLSRKKIYETWKKVSRDFLQDNVPRN